MTKKILSITLAASLFLLSACSNKEPDTSEIKVSKTPVEVLTIAESDLSNKVILSGKIASSRDISVFATLPSKVESINVKVGDTVSKNSVLFTMDKADLKKQYDPIKESYDRSLKLNQETLAQAQKNLENTKALYEIGAASKVQVEQAELSLLQTQTNFDSQMSQLETNMDSVLDSMNDASVKAPISGIVTQVNVIEGMPASNSAAAVVISEASSPQIRVDVSETLVPYIKNGDTVKITIPSLGTEGFNATIRSISPSTDDRTGLYSVKIDLPKEEKYVLGMFSTVEFTTNEKKAVINIPTSSIVTDGDVSYVFVVDDSNTARKVEITTGITDGTNTEITSGLILGQKLVTKGFEYLSDNSLVNITGGN